MSDIDTLSDAFAELERRADAVSAGTPADLLARMTARHRSRLPLIAATVLAVLALAAGITLLAQSSHSRTQAGGSGAPTTPASTSDVTTIESTPTPTDVGSPAAFRIPQTPSELADRFRTVLGNSATFTVTDTGSAAQATVPSATGGAGSKPLPLRVSQIPSGKNGAAIVGTLMASGTTGGFDIQVFQNTPGSKASCDDPDRSRCSVRPMANGAWLAQGSEPLAGPSGGVTYQVDYVRSDGVEFLMHVSNERDPKGDSPVLAASPPLSQAQMVAIVTSDRW
ncbi:MAG: hypothetical protein ACRDVG_13670 [Jatrophihabitantaceae bacterium]